MKKRYVLLVVCLLALLTAAVYSQRGAVTRDGLWMQLSTNRDRYEVGEPLDLKLMLRNESEEPLNYQFANSPIYDFWVTTGDGKEVWRYSKGKSFAGRQQLRLEPGEMKVYQAAWNQMDNQGKPVQLGWYEVYARFMVADQGQEPLRTRIKIDDKLPAGQVVILVPVNAGAVNPYKDVGKHITVEGTLRQSPQGLYIEVKDLKIQR